MVVEENPKDNKRMNESFDIESKTFEQILSKISCKLTKINLNKEYLIDECLEEMGSETNSSRSYIFLFKNNLEYMDNVYEWCAKGISSEKDKLQNLKTKNFLWWMGKLESNEIIVIEDVEKMPTEAEIEKEILLEQGIRSLIVLPIFDEDILIGYVGLDNIFKNKNWNEQTKFLLRLISETFSGAFSRLQHERELRDVNEELSKREKHINSLKAQIVQQEEMLRLGQSEKLSKRIGLNEENFNEIINNVIDILNFDMMIFDKVELNLSENMPRLICNKIEISQVIMNILKNAIYEMNKKTEVVEENGQAKSNILKIDTYSQNGYLVCEICDNGRGISEEVKYRLFEPFFTTKKIGEGTGLGLALAYDIITNKHNGEIKVSESQWKGAKFAIKIPHGLV